MDIHCLPKCTINYLQESDKTLINDQCPSCSNICNQAVNSELDRNPFLRAVIHIQQRVHIGLSSSKKQISINQIGSVQTLPYKIIGISTA